MRLLRKSESVSNSLILWNHYSVVSRQHCVGQRILQLIIQMLYGTIVRHCDKFLNCFWVFHNFSWSLYNYILLPIIVKNLFPVVTITHYSLEAVNQGALSPLPTLLYNSTHICDINQGFALMVNSDLQWTT